MRCVHEPSGRITPLLARSCIATAAKEAWRKGGNYAAQSGDIKVVVITLVVSAVAATAAAMLAATTAAALKFQLHFELSAVCSYANMRNCI